jgi:ATP-dependent Clp protease protease subunit
MPNKRNRNNSEKGGGSEKRRRTNAGPEQEPVIDGESFLEQLGLDNSGGGEIDTIFENEYYMYEQINQDSMTKLLQFLRTREKEWDTLLLQLSDVLKTATPEPIKLYINSPGGDLHAVLPVIDFINHLRGKIDVHIYVEGVAASAASLLAAVGHKRFCSRNSFLLIHELRTSMCGTYSNFQDETYNCDKLMAHIKSIYIKHSHGKLTMEQLDAILKRDILLSAEECEGYGLIDEIIG